MRGRIAFGLVVIALLAGGCGGDSEQSTPTVTVSVPVDQATTTTSAPPATTTSTQPDGTGPAETSATDPRVNELERSAARTVRSYVAALDARDGAAVCALLAPGALDAVKMPVDRGSCAASLDASIGYRDPRGLPVWDQTKILKLRKVEVDGQSAKVIASIVSDFSDPGRDPSYEDDVIYLTRSNGSWVLTKASSTLYRAIGAADVPLAVLSPPD